MMNKFIHLENLGDQVLTDQRITLKDIPSSSTFSEIQGGVSFRDFKNFQHIFRTPKIKIIQKSVLKKPSLKNFFSNKRRNLADVVGLYTKF